MRSGAETQPTEKLHPTSWHKNQFERVVLQRIYYKRPKIATVSDGSRPCGPSTHCICPPWDMFSLQMPG